MKKYFINSIRISGGFVFSLFGKKYLRNKITIFNFHDVTYNPSKFSLTFDLNINPNLFEYQIQFIIENFNIISPADLINGKLKNNSAIITFDDGFKGVFEHAIPILKKYNLPSIVFLNMSVIYGEVFWAGTITYLCKYDPNFINFLHENKKINQNKPYFLYCDPNLIDKYFKIIKYLDIENLKNYIGTFASVKDLQIADQIEGVYFGNHLDNHYVSLNLNQSDLENSYIKNKNLLSSFNSTLDLFAFPFGQINTTFNADQIYKIQKLGALKIFSTHALVNDDNYIFLHRIPLFELDNTKYKIWFRILYKSFINFFKLKKNNG